MRLFRITSSEYIDDISGTGAKLFGGRWNKKGSALLYTSENISLAILEILVHFDGLTVPQNLELLELNLKDDLIQNFSYTQFNKIRRSKDSEYQFKETGDKWIEKNKVLALKVPSIINPYEYNVIINPKHEKFKLLKKKKKQKLELDIRLFK